MTSGTVICKAILILLITVSVVGADDAQRTIRVAGEGKATAVPDMATIQLGVVTQATQAVEAMSQNNEVAQRLMAELKKLQVAERDIQTSQFHVQPDYERGPRGESRNTIVGYRVSNQITIRVRELPDLGNLLDALIRTGSNQVSGISLGVNDSAAVMNMARVKAIEDAQARARLYAEAAGVMVGKVVAIDEQQAVFPQPVYLGRAMEMSAADVPIASGEQEFTAAIHMTFELVDE
jgi:uncharacterized protein YggE